MTPQKDVSTLSNEASFLISNATLPRALYGGTEAMRKAGEVYLPKEMAESADAYTSRKNRTFLFNAFGKTVDDMAGRVFAKEIKVKDGAPKQIIDWVENIDLAGSHLSIFALQLFKDALQVGLSHILVDTPTKSEGATKADEIKGNIRPYFTHIRAEDVLGWKSEIVDGVYKLTQLRITESVDEPDGEFHIKKVNQIRVFMPFSYQTYRQNDKKKWVLYNQGARDISDIPLATVYLNKQSFMMAIPPLRDLAFLNVAHWQSSSDQRNILHVARVPILFASGFKEKEDLVVGAGAITYASDANAKLSFTEHSGAAIGSGSEDLKEIEFQMQAMGLQLLAAQPKQSATGEIREDIKENSRLAQFAFGLKDGLEQAFVFMAQMAGLPDNKIEVEVNTDFGVSTRGQQDLTILLNAVQNNIISKQTFYEEMQRRGVFSENFNMDDEPLKLSQDALDSIIDPSQEFIPQNDTVIQ